MPVEIPVLKCKSWLYLCSSHIPSYWLLEESWINTDNSMLCKCNIIRHVSEQRQLLVWITISIDLNWCVISHRSNITWFILAHKHVTCHHLDSPFIAKLKTCRNKQGMYVHVWMHACVFDVGRVGSSVCTHMHVHIYAHFQECECMYVRISSVSAGCNKCTKHLLNSLFNLSDSTMMTFSATSGSWIYHLVQTSNWGKTFHSTIVGTKVNARHMQGFEFTKFIPNSMILTYH